MAGEVINLYQAQPRPDDDEQGARRLVPFRDRIFYAAQMQGRDPRPREFVIDGVVQRKSVLLFAGPPKIGKSLLIQQLLTAVSLGQPFLDRETVQCSAFGLFTEDPQNELEHRQSDLNVFYDRDPADYELDLSWASLEGEQASLVGFDRYGVTPHFQPLWHQLWQHVKREGVGIVGLDNARVLFGGSEISAQQVTAFVRLLVGKAIEHDCAIILAAHPAKNDPRGFSGTGAWLASVRAGLSLHRPGDWDEETHTLRDPRRVLSGLGMNYGAGIGSELLEIRNGLFVPIARPERREKRGPLNDIQRQDLRYRLLMGLKKVIQNGGRVTADVEDPKSMANRARRSTDPEINRIPLNDLYLAQEDLIELGQVVRVDVGRRCLIRPNDGPYYAGEVPWLPIAKPASPSKAEAAE